jgi:hypothetical protein
MAGQGTVSGAERKRRTLTENRCPSLKVSTEETIKSQHADNAALRRACQEGSARYARALADAGYGELIAAVREGNGERGC